MGCFVTLNSYFYQNFFQAWLLNFIQIAKTPLLLGLRQKWMIPSCSLWKVVTFFGKEHVNWSSINGDMIGKSWTIKSIIVLIPPIFSFSNWIFQHVTTFHGEQDGIIHFCLSHNEMGVLALWIYISTKKFMAFSNLDFLTSSYHNSTNTGPIDMFFTKKCNYFSRETRWNHPLLSQPP